MLRYMIIFFLLAVGASFFGFGGLASDFAGIARILALIFIVLFLVALVYRLMTGHRSTKTLLLIGFLFVGLTSVAKAEGNDHAAVYDRTGSVVRSVEGACVRTQWLNDFDRCAEKPFLKRVQQLNYTMRRAKDFSKDERTVYFVFNKHTLTSNAKKRLNTLTMALKADVSVKEAKIVGFADRIGSTAYNEKLSQKRAETVRNYLIQNGYTKASVTETRWVGEEEPRADCKDVASRSKLITCLQVDRRVEVEMLYVNDK